MGTTLFPVDRGFAGPLIEGRADCRKPALVRRCAQPMAMHKPVRVTRVMDDTRQAGQAGCMRISGRLADVCAELERLAQLEAR